jgi:hypothetical protein
VVLSFESTKTRRDGAFLPRARQPSSFGPLHGLGVLQRKASTVSHPGDAAEREADDVADRVLRDGALPAIGAAPDVVQRKCDACQEEEKKGHVQRAADPARDDADANPSTATALSAATGGGVPLGGSLRAFLEPRFGQDFSHVRVHADSEAERAARSVNARAYTVGNHILFGRGEYAPTSQRGLHLLAHELTHVVQQRAHGAGGAIQRCANAAEEKNFDATAKQVKAKAQYKALKDKTLADKIVTESRKRNNCIYLIDKLNDLFGLAPQSGDATAAGYGAATTTATTNEAARLKTPAGKAGLDLEKKAADRAVFDAKKRPGLFGGGKYEIDSRDPLNVVVRLKIRLTPKGKDGADVVAKIEGMKDAIEKAASTVGYIVSIDFVKGGEADAFQVDVDKSKPEVATNWSGGDPVGFAHEIHHLLTYEIDKYDYILAHYQNAEMDVSERLVWFDKELSKPAGWNDPTSIIASAAHPNDTDVCTVVGTDIPGCTARRGALNKILAEITGKFKTAYGRVEAALIRYSNADKQLWIGVLRELFRRASLEVEARDRIKTEAKGTYDFGKMFRALDAADQAELLAILAV